MHRIFFYLFYFYMVGCSDNKFKLVVIFEKIDGLREGSEVKAKGLPVGIVEKVDLHEDGIMTRLTFNEQFNISRNSRFILETELTGGQNIIIELTNDSLFVNHLDTLKGFHSVESEQYIMVDSAGRGKKKRALKKIGEGIKELFEKDTTLNSSGHKQ